MGNEPNSIPADPCFTVENIKGHLVVTFTTDELNNPVELARIGHKLYTLTDENLDRAGVSSRLVLDFKNVRYFASQAVGILLTLNKKLGRGPAFTYAASGRRSCSSCASPAWTRSSPSSQPSRRR